jgi:hypothetical protein
VTFVKLLADVVKLLLLLKSLGELGVDVDLSLTAGLRGCCVRLHLVSIDALSRPEFLKIQSHALLNRSEIVEAIEQFDLVVTSLHVAKVVKGIYKVLWEVL